MATTAGAAISTTLAAGRNGEHTEYRPQRPEASWLQWPGGGEGHAQELHDHVEVLIKQHAADIKETIRSLHHQQLDAIRGISGTRVVVQSPASCEDLRKGEEDLLGSRCMPLSKSEESISERFSKSMPAFLVTEASGQESFAQSVLKDNEAISTPVVNMHTPTKSASERLGEFAKCRARSMERAAPILCLQQVQGWRNEDMPKHNRTRRILGATRDICCGRQAALISFVGGLKFEFLCGLSIFCNSIYCGIKAQLTLSAINSGNSPPAALSHGDLAFSLLFLVEWMTRIAAYQRTFFTVKEWRWHLFDTMLVTMTMIEMLTEVFLPGAERMQDQATISMLLRVIRIVRLVRLLRVVRYFSVFRELRLMVFGLLKSAQSLAWSMLFLALVIYFFAICIQLVVNGHLSSLSEGPQNEDIEKEWLELLKWWGSFDRTMITLFMAISGGTDWRSPSETLRAISPFYSVVFCFYIMVTMYGVLNVMTATFVESAMITSRMDRDMVIREEMTRKDSYMSLLKQVFSEADSDQSGTISLAEFNAHLEDERIMAYFAAMELNVSEAKGLFRLLDKDESDEVNIDEFLTGCFRLKGTAKGLDLQTLMYENKRMMGIWLKFMSFTEEEFSKIKRSLSILSGHQGGGLGRITEAKEPQDTQGILLEEAAGPAIKSNVAI